MPKEPYLTYENADKKVEEWLREISKYTRPREHLKFSIENSALLVIDAQNYFCSPEGRRYIPSAPIVLKKIEKLLKFFRERGRPIFFTQHCHSSPNRLGMFGSFFDDYIRCGEWDSQLWESLKTISTVPPIVKDSYDAFFRTNLQEKLESASITELVISGFVSHLCCETTARSAFMRGFCVYWPADATASWREINHISSLLNAASGFAVITTTERLLS